MAKSSPPKKAPKAALGAPEPSTGYFAAADGAPIWFEDSGGEGPILFFVYGLACSIQHWKYPKEHFSDPARSGLKRRIVYLDFRGHGRSPAPRSSGRTTLQQLVTDIESLCEFRGIKGATFLGQSLGGTVALALADKRPDLVNGLVLLASPGRNPGPYFALQPLSHVLWRSLIKMNRLTPLVVRLIHAATVEALRSPMVKIPFREIVRNAGFNPALARTQDIEDYIASVLQVSPNVFFDLASDLAAFDASELSLKLTCPSLLVAGAQDRVVPLSEQKWLLEKLPKGQLAALDYGSHCPHFDDPSRVITIMDSFLSEHRL